MKMLGDQGGNADRIGDDRIPQPNLCSEGGPSSQPKKFHWETSWLTGEQYLEILENVDLYCQRYGFRKFPPKTHPEQIYTQPLNGTIYFVEGGSIGSEFGFPRNNTKKCYKWKKMNFRTNLPKSNPSVTYIVASASRCERLASLPSPQPSLFRMHVVMPYKRKQVQPLFVLCHIRQVENHNSSKVSSEGQVLPSLMLEVQGSLVESPSSPVSYFNLFRIIHNKNREILESESETYSE